MKKIFALASLLTLLLPGSYLQAQSNSISVMNPGAITNAISNWVKGSFKTNQVDFTSGRPYTIVAGTNGSGGSQTPWTNTINAAQFPLTNLTYTVYVNTNLYTGQGTLSSSVGSHYWTNSGAGSDNLQIGNYLVITNFQTTIIVTNIGTHIFYTRTPSDKNYSGSTWKYYSNYATIYDSVPRQVGFIDGGGGIGIMGTDPSTANDGHIWLLGGTNTWDIMSSTDGTYGSVINFTTAQGTVNAPFRIFASPNYDTLDVMPDGTTSHRNGLTNIFGTGLKVWVPVFITNTSLVIVNNNTNVGPGTIGITNGTVTGSSTTFLTTFKTNSGLFVGTTNYRVIHVASDTSMIVDSTTGNQSTGTGYFYNPESLTVYGAESLNPDHGFHVSPDMVQIRGANSSTLSLQENGASPSAWWMQSSFGNFFIFSGVSNKGPFYIDKSAGNNELQLLSGKAVVNGFQLNANTNHPGFVLTADANGNGTWAASSSTAAQTPLTNSVDGAGLYSVTNTVFPTVTFTNIFTNQSPIIVAGLYSSNFSGGFTNVLYTSPVGGNTMYEISGILSDGTIPSPTTNTVAFTWRSEYNVLGTNIVITNDVHSTTGYVPFGPFTMVMQANTSITNNVTIGGSGWSKSYRVIVKRVQ